MFETTRKPAYDPMLDLLYRLQARMALRMGPGYFPTWLGGIMSVFGVVVFARSFFLQGEGMGEWALREHGSDFLFVEGYPTAKRPFYTMPSPAEPEVSNSFDLLFRGLELITGGQREHRYECLVAVMEARGISREPFEGYLDAFRFGMPPEGGFAVGLERFVAQLLSLGNVREVTAFPRDLTRLTP
jgi:aspartyl/asparaginyl-tRNA synthetase